VEKILSSVPEKQWTLEIQALFTWVKDHIRYLRDVEGIEYVQTPVRHIINIMKKGISYGDCDDSSLLMATLLLSAGYKARFVIIRQAGNAHFSHIFSEAYDPSIGTWVALDCTMKDKPYGWRPEGERKEFML
jgi:transglutaminase-like putative cysteine protease